MFPPNVDDKDKVNPTHPIKFGEIFSFFNIYGKTESQFEYIPHSNPTIIKNKQVFHLLNNLKALLSNKLISL